MARHEMKFPHTHTNTHTHTKHEKKGARCRLEGAGRRSAASGLTRRAPGRGREGRGLEGRGLEGRRPPAVAALGAPLERRRRRGDAGAAERRPQRRLHPDVGGGAGSGAVGVAVDPLTLAQRRHRRRLSTLSNGKSRSTFHYGRSNVQLRGHDPHSGRGWGHDPPARNRSGLPMGSRPSAFKRVGHDPNGNPKRGS